MPRPTVYDRAKADRILAAVADGASLKAACLSIGVLRETARKWAKDDRDGFGGRLAEAEIERYQAWEEDLIEHAKAELGSDSMSAVQARRTLIDTMKWVMARRVPQLWGEKVEHVGLSSPVVQILLPSNGREGPLIEGEATALED